MPQTKIEIKYFSPKIKNFFRNTDVITSKNITVSKIEELQKNITGGKE